MRNPLSAFRDWLARDDEIPDEDTPGDGGEPEGDCPAGGEHEPVAVRAATARGPLYTFCRRCRAELPNDTEGE